MVVNDQVSSLKFPRGYINDSLDAIFSRFFFFWKKSRAKVAYVKVKINKTGR